MKVEGVNFVDEEVKKMKKKEFINKHKGNIRASFSKVEIGVKSTRST